MRLALLAGLLTLAACEAPQQRLDAAQDVHAFLAAARTGDAATFDKHLDRGALKVQLRGELAKVLGDQPGIPAAAQGPMLDQMVDNFGPEAFQVATQGMGPLADRTPSAPEIAAVLKPIGEDRVCLPPSPGADTCAATFQRQGEVWRLVAIDAGGIRVGPAAIGDMLENFPR
jgi:hypothetical protein